VVSGVVEGPVKIFVPLLCLDKESNPVVMQFVEGQILVVQGSMIMDGKAAEWSGKSWHECGLPVSCN
jgi:hypothetical protein